MLAIKTFKRIPSIIFKLKNLSRCDNYWRKYLCFNNIIINKYHNLSLAAHWSNSLVTKYSHPVPIKDLKILDSESDINKMNLLIPLIIHNPKLDFEILYKFFTLHYLNPELFVKYSVENQELFANLIEKFGSNCALIETEQLFELAMIVKELNLKILSNKYLKIILNEILSEIMMRLKMSTSLSGALFNCSRVHAIFGNNMLKSNNIFVILENYEDEMNTMSVLQALQILMYIGINSNPDEVDLDIINKVTDAIEKDIMVLTFGQITDAIVAAFRINIKLGFNNSVFNEHLLKLTKDRLSSGQSFEEKELLAFITALKELRYRKCYDDELSKLLHKFISDDPTNNLLIPDCIADTVAILSINKYYNKELYNKFEEAILDDLKTQKYKMKSLSRILWGLSNTGHECSQEMINEIVNNLICLEPKCNSVPVSNIQQHNHNEKIYSNYIYNLCGCCLSLAQLGYFPEKLISRLLIESIDFKASNRMENYYKKLLILNEVMGSLSLTLWKPDLADTVPIQLKKLDIAEDSDWEPILKAVEIMNDKYKTKTLYCDYVVPYFNTPNIIYRPMSNSENVFGDTCIAIDLVDSYIQNTNTPTGLAKLKQNILQANGWKTVSILKSDFNQCNFEDKIHLLNESLSA